MIARPNFLATLLPSVLSLSLCFASSAQASEGVLLNLEVGYPSLILTLAPNLSPNLGSTAFLGLEASITLSGLPVGLGFFERTFFGGKFGSLPAHQTGLSAYFYPFSRPDSRLRIDNEVVVESTAWVVYAKLQGGLQFLNLNDKDTATQFGNASPFYFLAAGTTLPITVGTRAGVDVGYISTINATDPNQNPIALYGFLISGHVSFFFP